MEMILDAGKDTIENLKSIAVTEKKQLDVVALEMLSLGIRVYLASKENESSGQNEIDMHRNILKQILINNEILSEILSIIFKKERSRIGAYDCESAIKMASQFAEKYIKGGEEV